MTKIFVTNSDGDKIHVGSNISYAEKNTNENQNGHVTVVYPDDNTLDLETWNGDKKHLNAKNCYLEPDSIMDD